METLRTYPIKAVSVKTGLSIHVIRVWEKRYQAIIPTRTETNRRVYTEEDLKKLMLLRKATQQGHNIGSVAKLSTEELEQLVSATPENIISKVLHADIGDELNSMVDECLHSIMRFDGFSFEKILLNASIQLSQSDLLERLIIPLITKIGEFWHGGQIRIMHEHMATAILKNFLSNLRNNYRIMETAPSIIVTTPIGQYHELGILILSVIAASEGLNVAYLGPNLPADEIASAAIEKKAKAVLLSIVYPADDHYLKLDLKKLGTLLPDKIKVIVGGRMASNYLKELKLINAVYMENFDDFKIISRDLKK
jgi:DNA-binding transcriptional MerR regulator/methylmalonyl-CoA mutase cobalamin-binding subunit